MNSKLSKIFNKRLPEIPTAPDPKRPHPHTSVGIEVELEGVFHTQPEMKMWNVVGDGSLINGIEFVSEPVWGTAISDALHELSSVLRVNKPVVSFRTSTHIHVNCLDMTGPQLIKMIKIYLMYEAALFRLHEGRENNIFCVPAYSSVVIQRAYGFLFDYVLEVPIHRWSLRSKYAALNINSLLDFGTLEFRHMSGCVDVRLISNWIDLILQIKAASLREDVDIRDPSDVWGVQLQHLDIRDGDLEKGQRIIDSVNMRRH